MRTLVSLVTGLLTLAVVSAASFTLLYVVVGAEVAFRPSSFVISTAMACGGFVTTALAGAVGWIVCHRVHRTTSSIAFMGAAFAFTLAMGVPMLLRAAPTSLRDPAANRFESMVSAHHPKWFTLGSPVALAAGIAISAVLTSKRDKSGAGGSERRLEEQSHA